MVAADLFAGADGPEACARVEVEAGGVVGEDAGLDGPDAGGFGGVDEDEIRKRVQDLLAELEGAPS
ncbi:hypothetical protein ACFQY7_50380 [Actinomadura luteofluorescens]|uniref:hypothetical protein n=1 Tax=Actinomadura luteofluorescens TaxID=46163 RepID=UPI00337083A2